MPSLIPGYEYDIFISYRQKDNKGERWVSEFVEALKTELESTFKDEISVYFDVNPHDGLLETHDVDASLKEKLKCLVFIPIISRTYCDPKSFAWEHEFKAFIDGASQDQFGLKIGLPKGNVASRVLPVRIHELDREDLDLCESLLGGVLRGVDFVFRSPGVNRPLRASENNPQDNLNKTNYRDQINKVANAIEEIISSLSSEVSTYDKEKTHYKESGPEIKTGPDISKSKIPVTLARNSKSILILVLCVLLCGAGTIFIYHYINKSGQERSIAILPFRCPVNDPELINKSDIFAEAAHTKLREVKKLTLRSRVSALQYRDTKKTLNTIRNELNVIYIVDGSIRREGDKILIWIGLIDAKDDKQLWSDEYIWENNRFSVIISEITRNIASGCNAVPTPEEMKQIDTNPTKNSTAYINYLSANTRSYNAWSSFFMANKYVETISFSSAIEEYDKAIKADTAFAQAYAKRSIARSWGFYTRQVDSTHFKKCLEDIDKAAQLNKNLPDIQIALGFYYYYCKKDLDKALEFFGRASQMDTEDFQSLFYMAMVYRRKGDWIKSQNLINRVIALDPREALFLTNIGLTYTYFHNYDSALLYHQKAIDIMPAWTAPYKNKIETLLLKNGNTSEAKSLLDTAIQRTGGNFTEYKILLNIYDRKYEEALKEAERSNAEDYELQGIKYICLAEINNYLKNTEKVQKYYDTAIVYLSKEPFTDQNNPLIHSYIGIASAGLGNYKKAIEEGKKAVDLVNYDNFDKSDMILNLGKIYAMIGEYDQAIGTIDYLLQVPINIPSSFSIKLLQLDPVWQTLKEEPGFKNLLLKYSNK